MKLGGGRLELEGGRWRGTLLFLSLVFLLMRAAIIPASAFDTFKDVASATSRSSGDVEELTAYHSSGRGWHVLPGHEKDGLGWSSFADRVNSTGWAFLSVRASPKMKDQGWKDADQGFVVGFLEGFASAKRIYDAHLNWKASNKPLTPNVLQYMADQVASTHVGDPSYDYWQHVSVSVAQVRGLAHGYNMSRQPKLFFEDVYTLTMAGDLEDLINLPLNVASRFSPPAPNAGLIAADDVSGDIASGDLRADGLSELWIERTKKRKDMLDCSGLVKLTSDGSELFTGHTTFNSYPYMLRIFKHYTLALQNPSTAATTTSFSSRPGDLESKDDFYLLSSGLTVIETSLAIYNHTLFSGLTPKSVPCWLRVNIANRMAKSADGWAEIFSRWNSGTHNNEWVITDYNKFATYQSKQNGMTVTALPADTVWLLDQLPGMIFAGDVTSLLQKQGYVPSYNVPYFPAAFNISGYRAAGMNYETDPRGLMYKHYQDTIVDFKTMQWLMNSNDWQHNPYSLGTPCNAISARCDLQSPGPFAFGGIDSKVTSYEHLKKQEVVAISGPTHQTQPPFSFTPKWDSVPHAGMPDLWDFDWQVMTPEIQ